MSVFYANINNILDEDTWRILVVFANKAVADEWWEAVSSGSNSILAENVKQISPQLYTHNPKTCNVLHFFTDQRFQSVAEKFRGRMFLTQENNRGGRCISTLPPQSDTSGIPSRTPLSPPPSRPRTPTRPPSPSNPPSIPPKETSPAFTHQELLNFLSSSSQNYPSPEPKPNPPVTTGPPPPLHALLVGIDVYVEKRRWRQLRGTVKDANAMEKFLLETLKVPQKNITKLTNEQATRSNIENAIRYLASDSNGINRGDAILIFYAGHGAHADAPEGWPANIGPKDKKPQVQMLVPHDFNYFGRREPDRGQGVLDLVFAQLLDDIAEKKGDNITVILDCCHSSSSTRGGDIPETARGIELPPDYQIPLSILDQVQVGGSRGSRISDGFLTKGLRSHVLLAACLPHERAGDTKDGGRFTRAVLDQLAIDGTDNMTYKDLIYRIQDVGSEQHPQCEGVNKDRVLFNSMVPKPGREIYVVKFKNRSFIMEAGEVHGITQGAQFNVYTDQKLSQKLGTLKVVKPRAIESTMEVLPSAPSFQLATTGYAIQTRVGELEDITVFLPLHPKLLPLWQAVLKSMQSDDEVKQKIRYVNDPALAKLVLSVRDDDQIQYQYVDATAQKLGLRQMAYTTTVEPDPVMGVLRGAAHFAFHLQRSSSDARLAPFVNFECVKLVKGDRFDDRAQPVHMPELNGKNLNDNGLITIYTEDEEDVKYGFRLTNSSDTNMYAYVFYFDISNFEIVEYYHPGTAKGGSVEVPLEAKGELTIGYGSSGFNPQSYYLHPKQELDVGYIKIFLSTHHIDLGKIKQESPFTGKDRGMEPVRPVVVPLWDRILVTVLQKKRRDVPVGSS